MRFLSLDAASDQIPNQKSETITNGEKRTEGTVALLASDFGLHSGFWFRASNFPTGRCDTVLVSFSIALMVITDIPFSVIDWSQIEPVEHPGEAGTAVWRTRQFGSIRVRMVEYSPGYVADHWCSKGHVVICLAGELRTEVQDGRVFVMTAGMSYQVADGAEPHRSSTTEGARLFIVD